VSKPLVKGSTRSFTRGGVTVSRAGVKKNELAPVIEIFTLGDSEAQSQSSKPFIKTKKKIISLVPFE